jgi:hypothetical protein
MTNLKPRPLRQQLQTLLKLANAATPGAKYATASTNTWDGNQPPPEDEAWTISSDPSHEGWTTDCGHPGYGLKKADAEFYAASRSAVPALVRSLMLAVEALDSCGFDGDPNKRLEFVNATLKQIETIIIREEP